MTTRAESAEDLSPVCGDDPAPHPHVSPGEYDLLCTGQKLERIRMYGGAWKCRLEFRIMAIDAPKVKLVKFFHLGCGPRAHIGRKSDYWRAWTMANGGRLPRRGQTMTARLFVGKVFRCRVADVVTDFHKSAHFAGAVYSTVRQLLEVKTG